MAECRRARETGKPGAWVRRRGEAAWPNARQANGLFSPATREAEQGRPSGPCRIQSASASKLMS